MNFFCLNDLISIRFGSIFVLIIMFFNKTYSVFDEGATHWNII